MTRGSPIFGKPHMIHILPHAIQFHWSGLVQDHLRQDVIVPLLDHPMNIGINLNENHLFMKLFTRSCGHLHPFTSVITGYLEWDAINVVIGCSKYLELVWCHNMPCGGVLSNMATLSHHPMVISMKFWPSSYGLPMTMKTPSHQAQWFWSSAP